MSGKKLLLLILVTLGLPIGLLFHFLGPAAWRLWNIPVMLPGFADARSILLGVQASQAGYDPLVQNPFDPFGRVMAYPRAWLLLGVLPLSENSTVAVAVAEIGLFLVGVFVFMQDLSRADAVWIAVLLISPAAMLCFERANTDLVVFFLLGCALALLTVARFLSLFLVELAAILKLYPIAALTYLMRESKKYLVPWLLAGLLLFALYALLTLQDIRRILSMAPKGVGFNYGVTVAGIWLLDLTQSRWAADTAFAVSYLLAYAGLICVLYAVHRAHPVLTAGNARSLDALRLGASLYITTFLQGNTWIYRLIFLIFTIPQVVAWARSTDTRRIATICLILIMASVWLPLLGATEPPIFTPWAIVQFLMNEVANWGLFACFAYLLFASLPDWIQQEIHLFFEKYSRVLRSAV